MLKIANGYTDLRKQDSLYVRIGNNGALISNPNQITEKTAQEELDRAKKFSSMTYKLSDAGPNRWLYSHLVEPYFKELFTVSLE